VRFGTKEENSFVFPKHNEFSLTSDHGIYTILDTGSTMLHISSLWFDSFIEELEVAANTEIERYKGRLYSRCLTDFPSLFFLSNNTYLEMAAKDYMIDVSKANDGSICLLQITPTTLPFLIFGMPLFVDYTSTFDNEARKVFLVPT